MPIVKLNKAFPAMWPSYYEDFFNWPELSDSTDMDIYETDNAVVVKASVPGVSEELVDVTVEGNVLTINASCEETSEDKSSKKTIYKNSRKTSFSYSTSLPRLVDSANATADVSNGVVTVTIPKSEKELPKKIHVKKLS